MARRVATALVIPLLLVVGCSDDDGGGDGTGDGAEATTTTAPTMARSRGVVEALADDELAGRDNGTPGSEQAQEYLVTQLAEFAEPLAAGAQPDGFRHAFPDGTNLLAIVPGGELAEEYVVVGAHYDHLGRDCRADESDPDDDICNGATDNATGVAAVLEIGRALAADPDPPRRSVVLALWDTEEDSLAGSRAYVSDPPVPLEDTLAYVNLDIQGANLSPALADLTVVVGAETGGPALVAAAERASEASELTTLPLSLLFGQGRSDHASFASVRTPTVFFTDANAPCYHTTGDEAEIVDYDKLEQQIAAGEALVRDLASTDDVPEFDADAPPASYDDAVSMAGVVDQATPDFDRFAPADEAASRQFVEDIQAVVDAGPDAFDDAAVRTLLGGSADLVRALSIGECEGFLEEP